MKKVIILAYDFPPYISVGAQRPYHWFKNLIKFGIKPVVFTRYWEKDMQGEIGYVSPGRSKKCEIEELECGLIYYTQYRPNIPNKLFLRYGKEKHKVLRRTLSAFIEFLQYFILIGPKKNIYREANKYLKKNNDIDLIIATGDPFILLHYAAKLSRKHKVPWIADYRDPWSHTDMLGKTLGQKSIERWLERRINKSAHRITTVSELLKNFIVCDNKDKISVVGNGFNDEYLNLNLEKQNNDVLTIAYAGSIQRFFPVRIFLEAIDSLRNDGKSISVVFYGINNENELKTVIQETFPNLKNQIRIISKIPNEKLLIELSKANLLLLFNSYASYGTKIYDYFAVKRNILLCFTEDQKSIEDYYKYRRIGFDYNVSLTAQAELIEKTRSGICIRDSKHLVDVLNEAYFHHKMFGNIECKSVDIERFSRGYQTKILSDIIIEVSNVRNSQSPITYPKISANLPVILILAYDFPPYVSAGGLRPYSWSKYLIEYGLYPVVVTRQWENKYGNNLDYVAPSKYPYTFYEIKSSGMVIRTHYMPNLSNRILLRYGDKKFVKFRRFYSAVFEVLQFIFLVGAKRVIYKGAKDYISRNRVDLIVATGDPFVLFKYASSLSRKYKVPWIADYRDAWTQDQSGHRNKLLSNYYKVQERKILRNCSQILTVSEYLISHISKNLPDKKFNIVLNGYDSNNLESLKNIKQFSDLLTISYAGTIYNWHPWKEAISIINKFAFNNKIIVRLNFYGVNKAEDIQGFIIANNLNSLEYNFYSKMANFDLLKELTKSNLLLLFNDYSILGTKIFDYLIVKRLILLCFTKDSQSLKLKDKYFCLSDISSKTENLQEEVILKTNSGFIVDDQKLLLNILSNIYNEFSANHFVDCQSYRLESFSRKEQTTKFANILKQVMNGK